MRRLLTGVVLCGLITVTAACDPTSKYPSPKSSPSMSAEEARRLEAEARKKIEAETLKSARTGAKQLVADKRRAAKDARAAAEKAKQKANEFSENGLTLMLNSLSTEESAITGLIVNRTGRQLEYAEIRLNLYDKSGAQVGYALANVIGLEPSGRWKFRAFASAEYDTYKPVSMSAH